MQLRSLIAAALALALSGSMALAQTGQGSSPLTVVKGGTGAGTASAARTSLGLAIGSNVEAWDADLDCIAAISATGIIKRTGAGTCSAGAAAAADLTNGTTGSGSVVLAASPSFTGTIIAAAATFSGTVNHTGGFQIGGTAETFPASGQLVGTTDAQTLTNKTFVCANQTSCVVRLASDVSGNLPYSNLPTGVSDTVIGFWGSTTASALAINNCSNALTYSTSTHTFGCNTTAGTGTVSAAGTGLNLTGGGSTLNLALTNATLQGSPTDPASTTSATIVMAGLGVTTCRIAPVYSTRLRFDITGYAFNSATNITGMQLRYGTGSGPANGAASTGTQLGKQMQATSAVASAQVPFTLSGIATGLTLGTTYWFDAGFLTNGGTSTLNGVTCVAMEF